MEATAVDSGPKPGERSVAGKLTPLPHGVRPSGIACPAISVFCMLAVAKFPTPSFLLARGQAGDLRIGMTVEEVYRIMGPTRTKLVDLDLEGYFTPALQIYLQAAGGENPPLVARITCKDSHASSGAVARQSGSSFVVDLIEVYDRRFRTRDGLGVGSKFGEIRKQYPRARPSAGEGTVVLPAGPGLSFSLNTTRIPQQWYTRGHDSSVIPDDTNVIAVFVYRPATR